MTACDVGVMLPNWAAHGEKPNVDRFAEAAIWAEKAGFHSIWVGDHLYSNTSLLESVTSLAYAAALTTSIRIGTAVLLAALRRPAVIARQLSSLAYLSRDRLIVGVGIGGEFPAEWEACGVPLSERAARTEEAIAVLREMFEGGEVQYSGRFVSLQAVRLDPAPRTPVPIVLAGRHEKALRRAARLGDGWLGFLQTPKGFRAARDVIEVERTATSRSDVPFSYGMLLSTYQTDGPEPAVEAARVVAGISGAPPGALERYMVAGTANQMLDRLHQYVEAGCSRFVLNPVAHAADMPEQFAILATDILPALTEPTRVELVNEEPLCRR
jgi:alkanesulfonate monooxygenase SsuD/methylene tetrahydromethanopterin reductase-like flavin-dependent oxidoreductase (luciferase family)